ncbi:hypothetical protein E6H17_06810 [Candidatus Bathyarchaeota archaeon]|nr:MAG: hypothetical protein E6H17_06810 [Candidatus Bathyarchaeota archaeon]
MGVEEEAQPKKSGSRRYIETLLGWHGEDSAGSNLYQTTLLTSILEYGIILFFGVWLVTEYFYNIYEQQYFGSFNPVFLVVVLMIASAYGFTRLISTIRTVLKPPKKTSKPEDDY